jgi:16S rRNA (cytosine967-C5)-methyltransferase
MAVSAARNSAFEILLRVEREASYASELLHSDAFAKLSGRDHGLLTELVMGVLRWRSLLDEQISAASSQKLSRVDLEVLTALRLGAYQLRFLTRVPARAAIFESVELVKAARKRSAAPFANAVLRKISSAAQLDPFGEISNAADAKALARSAAHPLWLVERWTDSFGHRRAQQICLHNQTVPAPAIHLHDDSTESELAAAGIELAPGRFLANARRVVAGNVSATQAFRERRAFIQDEASQLVALLAASGEKRSANKFSPGKDNGSILDCCAAPGSKTGLMALRHPQRTVFATELHSHRARLLHDLTRLPNVLVTVADARNLPFSRSFDRILADVPCSGTGTLGHNPEIKWRLKPEDLRDLQLRQVAILSAALQQLSIGGRLLYSTCSLETEENEGTVKAALKQKSEFKLIELKPELQQLRRSGELSLEDGGNDSASLLDGPYLRTIPGVHPCDGFFAALIERK